MDDIDTLYMDIEQDKKSTKAHTRKSNGKTIKVRSSVEVAKDEYKQAKATHRAQIKQLKRNIKSHRLMIRQSRNTYKLIKLGK